MIWYSIKAASPCKVIQDKSGAATEIQKFGLLPCLADEIEHEAEPHR